MKAATARKFRIVTTTLLACSALAGCIGDDESDSSTDETSDEEALTGFLPGHDGFVYLFNDAAYKGASFKASASVNFVGNAYNDKASSIINRTSRYIAFYTDANQNDIGGAVCMLPNSHIANLATYTNWNDRISSLTVYGAGQKCPSFFKTPIGTRN